MNRLQNMKISREKVIEEINLDMKSKLQYAFILHTV